MAFGYSLSHYGSERVNLIMAELHSAELSRYRELRALINLAVLATNASSDSVFWQGIAWPRIQFAAMLANLKAECKRLGKFLYLARLDILESVFGIHSDNWSL